MGIIWLGMIWPGMKWSGMKLLWGWFSWGWYGRGWFGPGMSLLGMILRGWFHRDKSSGMKWTRLQLSANFYYGYCSRVNASTKKQFRYECWMKTWTQTQAIVICIAWFTWFSNCARKDVVNSQTLHFWAHHLAKSSAISMHRNIQKRNIDMRRGFVGICSSRLDQQLE